MPNNEALNSRELLFICTRSEVEAFTLRADSQGFPARQKEIIEKELLQILYTESSLRHMLFTAMSHNLRWYEHIKILLPFRCFSEEKDLLCSFWQENWNWKNKEGFVVLWRVTNSF